MWDSPSVIAGEEGHSSPFRSDWASALKDGGSASKNAEEVSAGESVVIQERNHTTSVDVIEPGETVQIIYRRDGFSALLEEGTVPEG